MSKWRTTCSEIGAFFGKRGDSVTRSLKLLLKKRPDYAAGVEEDINPNTGRHTKFLDKGTARALVESFQAERILEDYLAKKKQRYFEMLDSIADEEEDKDMHVEEACQKIQGRTAASKAHEIPSNVLSDLELKAPDDIAASDAIADLVSQSNRMIKITAELMKKLSEDNRATQERMNNLLGILIEHFASQKIATSANATIKGTFSSCQPAVQDDFKGEIREIDVPKVPYVTVLPPSGSKTLQQIARKLDFYSQYTGRPNAKLVADILRNELGIDTSAYVNRNDKDAMTTVSVKDGKKIPLLWVKEDVLVKLQKLISSGKLNALVQSNRYKIPYKNHKPGDWMYDYIQFGGGPKHIIADENGERVKWA